MGDQVVPIDLDTLIAGPGFAPQKWQSVCPDFARDGGHKVPVAASPDLDRMASLPRREVPEEGSSDAVKMTTFMTSRLTRGVPGRNVDLDDSNVSAACRCRELFDHYGMRHPRTKRLRNCITELRMVQAWALLEITTMRGVFGAIGVGHGKTILDLLAPLVMPQCRTAVLLVPPGLVKQLIRDYEIVGQHFHMPSLITHDKNNVSRIVPGMPALHVFPYSRLSQHQNTDYLEETLKPDFIIADECHRLKAADTATTGRVLRYFKNHPSTRFAAWSGSTTDKSIKEIAHLLALALRLGSPLPIDPDTVEDMARAIDPPAPGGARAPEGALRKLCRDGEHYLHAFHRRLVETPGVISTKAAAVDAAIEIDERTPPPIPKIGHLYVPPDDVAKAVGLPPGEAISVAAALRLCRDEWKRPDGEELPDALARSRTLLELACGFFYRWRFPLVNGHPQSVATILQWLARRSDWNKEVRYAIRNRREHFDSEKLARNAAERGWGMRAIGDRKLPVWKAASFPAWHEIENEVVYETEAVWIDDWLARDAVEWGRTHLGIIWYAHAEFGEKVQQLSGLPLHTGGAKAGELIEAVTGDTSIIASIKSHGVGRDGLQFKFADQLVTSFPSVNDVNEQMLGRLHRIGQEAETVRAEFYRHTPELARNVNQALRRAGYVENLWKSAQKLNLAGVDMIDDEPSEWDLE